MKNKKIEKKVLFVFKKSFINLTKQQMQTFKGGDKPTEGPSVDPACTIVVDPTLTVQ